MAGRLICAGLLLSCVSCTPLQTPINEQVFKLDCAEATGSDMLGLRVAEVFRSDDPLLARYSTSSLVLANAYGLIDDLRVLEELRRAGEVGRIELLLKENRIDRRLDLVAHELFDLERFVDCKDHESSKIRVHLSEVNQREHNRLTNAAVLAGALSTVAVAAILVSENKSLQDGDAKDWIGVAGGVAASYLAVRSARLNRTVMLEYEPNLIAAIWRGDNSKAIFPEATWYLLNEDRLGDRAGHSIRKDIVRSWSESPIMLGDEAHLARLPELLEPVATYDEELLQLRVDMLEEIEFGIGRLYKKLLQFRQEVVGVQLDQRAVPSA